MNLINDLKNGAIVARALSPAAVTADGGGDSVDLIDGEGRVQAILIVGAVSGTNPTLDVKAQESADGSTWSDISGATFAQKTTATSIETIVFGRTKQYVRLYNDVGGTSPSFTIAAALIQQKKVV